MDQPPTVTPLTALVVNENGQLTYMGVDGRRRVIVGDADLLRRLQQIHDDNGNVDGGCGI
ncbi:hypothetical protein [Synechococcus sp. A15-28]|jgi:hypothetical protein|uniref:hypothetical protein n=1 Tax=Synechococcus sp. A15-28 TaxID=1050638 RepID=UPI001645DF68|nr:hypothetical protein [Synechococcus sp. A15-28]MBA4734254.1 hypothetical protein [Synechococcus sp.]QNI42461.1 hypothetical protein SynA1528_01431 [Synechococcus sp. A15-28]|tara:strand:+ start:3926 stop:4105 length:180 start_codon:yes stop_codon:yes gene_type:complete